MRLRISEKVVGSKLDKFGGGTIGKKKDQGNRMEKIWNECVQSCH